MKDAGYVVGPSGTGRAAVALLAGLALFLFGALSPSAEGATPIDLGPTDSGDPRVVVDESGTGYLTWQVFDSAQPGSPRLVRYCRLPQGSTSCATTKNFTYTSNVSANFGNAPVLADGGRIMVASGVLDNTPSEYRTFLYTSADGGQTFDGGTLVGENAIGIEGSVQFAPADGLFPGSPERILTTEGFAGTQYQATATTFLVTGTYTFSGSSTASNSTVLQGGTHLIEYSTIDFPSQSFSRLYDGGGDPHIASNWGPPQPITTVGRSDGLISGGSGIFLAYSTDAGAIAIRKYNAGSWGPPVELTGPLAGTSGSFSVAQSPSGIVHVAYIDNDGNLMYRYARSTANNDFTRPQTIVANPGNQFDFNTPELAVNSAGNGFISYRTDLGGGPIARTVPVAPGEGPEPLVPPAPPYSGPTEDVTTPFDGANDLVFTVPKACVATNSSFKVSVALKKKKKGTGGKGPKLLAKKKKTKVKIKSVDFSVGNVVVATDKKKPFEATISTAGVASGDLEITAKVTIKVKKPGKKKKTKTKTIKRTVKVC